MPDKQKPLKERLGNLRLRPQREQEILRELGDHLDDHAAALEARGVRSEEAARQALDAVPDWSELGNEILRAETEAAIMNCRTKVLWLPALCTFFLNAILLTILQMAGLRPHIYWLNRGNFIPFYIPWLLVLPLIGALGAFWSKRAGGTVSHRLLVSQVPLLIWLGIMLLMFLILAPITDRHVPLSLKLSGLLTYIVAWMLLPSLALFIGVAPFLRMRQSQGL